MGIYAKGSQFPADIEADTPQNRYGDLLTKDSAAGEALGETIAEVNATASSANTTVGEMIADIEALEVSYDFVSSDTLNVVSRRGRIVTASGRLVVPDGGYYVDLVLPSWAVSTVSAFIQFPAGYTDVSSRGQVRMSDAKIRLFGTAGQTLAYTVTWAV